MTQKLRAGRISNIERLLILNELGKIAQKKYNENLLHGAVSYNLGKLRNSLQFSPDPEEFDNAYWIEADSEELTKVAYYFEYGTGIFNTKNRKTARNYITPTNGEYMVWKDKKSQKMIFAKRTKGVRPVFMMTKAINYVRNNYKELLRKIRLKLNISTIDQGDQND